MQDFAGLSESEKWAYILGKMSELSNISKIISFLTHRKNLQQFL